MGVICFNPSQPIQYYGAFYRLNYPHSMHPLSLPPECRAGLEPATSPRSFPALIREPLYAVAFACG